MTDYVVYDVFTDQAFGGNPLAVIPDARDLSEDQLLPITKEFNLSETTFVYPAENGGDAKVRIFTPGTELMFAGHPTVGTALALRDLGLVSESLVLELGVGPIPVEITGNRARFVTRVPLAVEDAPSPAMIATCLGLPEAAIRTDNHAPVLAGLGTNFVLVELATLNDLTSAHGVLDAFHAAKPEGAVRLGIFLYVRDGAKIEARMFSPLSGIPEDPATGSASAALAAYLGQLDGRSQSFAISQGVAMGRPSQIAAEVTVEDGAPVAVAIEGSAVKVMEGRLMF